MWSDSWLLFPMPTFHVYQNVKLLQEHILSCKPQHLYWMDPFIDLVEIGQPNWQIGTQRVTETNCLEGTIFSKQLSLLKNFFGKRIISIEQFTKKWESLHLNIYCQKYGHKERKIFTKEILYAKYIYCLTNYLLSKNRRLLSLPGQEWTYRRIIIKEIVKLNFVNVK